MKSVHETQGAPHLLDRLNVTDAADRTGKVSFSLGIIPHRHIQCVVAVYFKNVNEITCCTYGAHGNSSMSTALSSYKLHVLRNILCVH